MKSILLISDMKAGHESLSFGIIQAIREKNDIQITKCEVRLRLFVKPIKKFITLLVNWIPLNKKFAIFLIKTFYQTNLINYNKKFDFIISTGGNTSFANIFFAQLFKIPNIYCSSLRGLNNKLFTFLVSIEDHNYHNEIVVELAPVYFIKNQKQNYSKSIALLLGGKTSYYQFSDEEFLLIVKEILALAKKHSYKLLITTSRRTPHHLENEIALLCQNEINIVDKLVLFNIKPEKVMNQYLNDADIVFCSEESGSMITEAILSKKPVYTIRPKKTKPYKIYDFFISNIMQKNYIKSISIEQIPILSLKEEFTLLETPPTQVVYNKIKPLLDLV